MDRIAPTRRPAGPSAGYHVWSYLLFAHWRVPASLVEPLIPRGLTLDTYEGDAWIGLVPFYMSWIRPRWAPALPVLSFFCETNVRTYVHHRGEGPGVWFFSLDAANSIAVRVARWKWHLAYHYARMSLVRKGDSVRYTSARLWPGSPCAKTDIRCHAGHLIGESDTDRSLPAGQALPGTLDHFLIERYILYAVDARGTIHSGRVYHTPYPVRTVEIETLDETLIAAAGIPVCESPCHVAFSDGVSVTVFPITPIAGGSA